MKVVSREDSENAQAGESPGAVYTQHISYLRRFLGARGARPHDVNDLVQEVLVVAWTKRDTVHPGKLRAFLAGVACNVLYAHGRKERARQALREAEHERIVESLYGPTSPNPYEDRWPGVCALILRLPPRQAEAIRLTLLEGRTQADAARRMGVSQPAVAKLVKTGLTRLREMWNSG